MCGGGKTKTSTSSTQALPEYQQAYSSLLGQAQNVASTPWNPNTGQQVAGFTAPQNQAFDATQANLGVYQPYLNSASSGVAAGSSPISASAIQNYLNPYTQNVVNATQAQFANSNAQQLQAANSNAAKIGALTGDRSQVAQSVLQGQQALAQNPIIAGLYSQGYTQALGAAQNDASRALQGAQINSALAGQAQQYGQNDIASLLGIGNLQQTQQQNVLNANTANAQAQAQYPFATTQWLASLATGLGGAAGSTGSQTTPGPNIWSQLLGGGLAAASLFNQGGRVGYGAGGMVASPLYATVAPSLTPRFGYTGQDLPFDRWQRQAMSARDRIEARLPVAGTQTPLFDRNTLTPDEVFNFNASREFGNPAGGNIRDGYASGGDVTGSGLPYSGAPSYVPTTQMPHGGMNHQGPMPSIGDNTQGGMSDVLSNFKQAHSAFQGLGNLGSKAFNLANTSTGPASTTGDGTAIPGWSTTTTPTGLSGFGNYLGNMFGFADGGSVEPTRGMQGTQSGVVLESPQMQYDRNIQELLGLGIGGLSAAQMAYGNVPAWLGGGAASVALDSNASSPDIHDVWAHQFHQWLKPRGYADGGDVTDLYDDGTGTYAMNVGSSLFPFARTDARPSPTPARDPWAATVSPAPALPPPSHLSPVDAPAPQQQPVATASPMATPYALPTNAGLFGIHLSDAARQGLLTAGLGMMASQSPWIGTAIGEGGLAGINSYSQAKQGAIENTQSKQRIDMAAQELALRAKQAAENMRIAGAQEARASEAFPLEQKVRQIEAQKAAAGQWTAVGTDEFGRTKYAFVNPLTQTVNAVPGAGINAGAAENTTTSADGTPLAGDDYLKTLPPNEATMVKKMVNGEISPPSSFVLAKSPYWNALMMKASQYDPDFDQTSWGARSAGRKDFYGGGKSAEMVRAANQTIDHVGHLVESMDKLQNTDYPLYNAAGNYVNKDILGKSGVGDFEANAHAVAEEMSKVFKGANLSDSEIREWEKNLSPNMSPEQQKAQVGKLMDLLQGSLRALEQKRLSSLGPTLSQKMGPLLNDHSQDVLDRVGKWTSGGEYESAPQKVQGKLPPSGDVARPKSKAEYDALPSGTQYVDLQGNVKVKQ